MVILYSIIVILNILDAIFTKILIQCMSDELNPMMRYVMGKFGILEGAFLVKLPLLLILGILLYVAKESKLLFRGMILLLVVYSLLTVYHIWNLTLI